jgi:hypothetical protein
VPQIFKQKFAIMRQDLKGTSPFFSRAVFVDLDEPALAPLLDQLSAAHTQVSIGSYLHWGRDSDYRTKLTIDGRVRADVEACFSEMCAGIPADRLVRVE